MFIKRLAGDLRRYDTHVTSVKSVCVLPFESKKTSISQFLQAHMVSPTTRSHLRGHSSRSIIRPEVQVEFIGSWKRWRTIPKYFFQVHFIVDCEETVMKMHWNECLMVMLSIYQHGMRLWLGALRQQAITPQCMVQYWSRSTIQHDVIWYHRPQWVNAKREPHLFPCCFQPASVITR